MTAPVLDESRRPEIDALPAIGTGASAGAAGFSLCGVDNGEGGLVGSGDTAPTFGCGVPHAVSNTPARIAIRSIDRGDFRINRHESTRCENLHAKVITRASQ